MEVIVEYMRKNPTATINDIASGLAIPYRLLSARMTEMEMDDIVTALPGGIYQLNI